MNPFFFLMFVSVFLFPHNFFCIGTPKGEEPTQLGPLQEERTSSLSYQEPTEKLFPKRKEAEEKETDSHERQALLTAKLRLLEELLPTPPPSPPRRSQRCVHKKTLQPVPSESFCAGAGSAGSPKPHCSRHRFSEQKAHEEESLPSETAERIKIICEYKNSYAQGLLDGKHTYCEQFKIDKNSGTCFEWINHCENEIKKHSGEDRLEKKIVKYWLGFKISCIACIEKPFKQGAQDALLHYKKYKNQRKKFLELLQRCNKNILEHSKFEEKELDTRNILYWTGLKMMLKTKMYEARDLIPPAFFLEWAKTDAQTIYNRATHKHVNAFCTKALACAQSQTSEKAHHMAEYWRRFKRNLEIKKLSDF